LSFLYGSIRASNHRRFRCRYRLRFWNYRNRNFLSRRLRSRLWSNLRFWFRNRWQWLRVGYCDGLIYDWWLLCRNRRFLRRNWYCPIIYNHRYLYYRRLFNGHRRLLRSHWRLFCRSWRFRLRNGFYNWRLLWYWLDWRYGNWKNWFDWLWYNHRHRLR
jgi:hypothetical protein